MPSKTEKRRQTSEFVQVGDQHIKLSRAGVLKLGVLSIDFHHGGPEKVIGFDAYCCKNDFGDCVLRKDGANCADSGRPITVWKFAS
jgi:hypothetical protein